MTGGGEGPRFTIEADAAALHVHVERRLSPFGWEHVVATIDRYLGSVDHVVLEGEAWESPAGQRVALSLRQRLPRDGVQVWRRNDQLAVRLHPEPPPRRARAPRRGPPSDAW
jgi:hypothetical protein